MRWVEEPANQSTKSVFQSATFNLKSPRVENFEAQAFEISDIARGNG